ncbi:MAG: hypothetical protein V3U11_12575 [Planctomycetota bacterium]
MTTAEVIQEAKRKDVEAEALRGVRAQLSELYDVDHLRQEEYLESFVDLLRRAGSEVQAVAEAGKEEPISLKPRQIEATEKRTTLRQTEHDAVISILVELIRSPEWEQPPLRRNRYEQLFELSKRCGLNPVHRDDKKVSVKERDTGLFLPRTFRKYMAEIRVKHPDLVDRMDGADSARK